MPNKIKIYFTPIQIFDKITLMKYLKRYSIILLFIFIHSTMLYAETVVLSNGEWKPYQSQDLKHGGYASHVVRKAFNLVDIKVKFEWYGKSWSRIYKVAKNNITDGSLVWSRTPKREREMYFCKDSIIKGEKTVLCYLRDNKIKYKNIKDLQGYKIGGIRGYTYGKKVDRAIKKGLINIERENADINNFRKLLAGRIDVFFIEEVVAKKILKEKLTKKERNQIILNTENPIRIVTYHLILNKKDPAHKELMKKFNKGFEKLKKSKKLQDLKNKFSNGYYKTKNISTDN